MQSEDNKRQTRRQRQQDESPQGGPEPLLSPAYACPAQGTSAPLHANLNDVKTPVSKKTHSKTGGVGNWDTKIGVLLSQGCQTQFSSEAT